MFGGDPLLLITEESAAGTLQPIEQELAEQFETLGDYRDSAEQAAAAEKEANYRAALEKLAAGDEGPSPRQPRYETLKFGVTWPREILKQRIDERLERRMKEGMAEEVRALLAEGVSEEFLVKLGLEYKYLTWYLTGKMDYDQMTEELGNAIKRFAKRQMTWFRKDPAIIWLDMAEDPAAQARPYIDAFLGN